MKWLIPFFLLFVIACEGPVGPEGPPGPQGPAGKQGQTGENPFGYYDRQEGYLDDEGRMQLRLEGRAFHNTFVFCYVALGNTLLTDGVVTSQPWAQVTTNYVRNEIDLLTGNTIVRYEQYGYCRITERFRDDGSLIGLDVAMLHERDRKYMIVAVGTVE